MRLKDQENYPQKVIFGIVIALALCVFILFVYLYFKAGEIKNFEKINEFGDTVAGFTAPIAIVFLILNYLEQSFRLREAERENYNAAKRSEFSSIGSIYYDILKDNLKFAKAGPVFQVSEIVIAASIQMSRGEFSKEMVEDLILMNQNRIFGEILEPNRSDYIRNCQSYWQAYRALIMLHSEAFAGKDTSNVADFLNYDGPFDATSIGFVGRRMAYYFERQEIIEEVAAGHLRFSRDGGAQN